MKTFELNGITLNEAQMRQVAEAYNKPEFEYPIFKRWKRSGEIVKFSSIYEGMVVFEGDQDYHEIGFKSDGFEKHTSSGWEDVAYDKERDLWDGQPIYCWDDKSSHERIVRFYDAISKCSYNPSGEREGDSYIKYEAINPEQYTEWIIDAYNTLER